jgi:hypothetical protein
MSALALGACSNECDPVDHTVVDSFQQGRGSEVDVLVIANYEPAMTEFVGSLVEEVPSITSDWEANGVDYHLAMATSKYGWDFTEHVDFTGYLRG